MNIPKSWIVSQAAGDRLRPEPNVKGASKNSEFAQMQGGEKISPRCICFICKQEIFYATQQLG
jgi:hypothetical protein